MGAANNIIWTYFETGGEIMSDDELLTLEEVAKRLHVHVETVRRYIKQKKLTAIRLSNTNLRVRESELNRFLKERETGGDTDNDRS